MQLNKVQKNIVFSKPTNCIALKGGEGTGKTTAAMHRIMYLKNNYCLYKEDKILMIIKDQGEIDKFKGNYEKFLEEASYEYFTLFTNEEQALKLHTLDSLIKRYFTDLSHSLISKEDKYNIVRESMLRTKKLNSSLKLLKESYIPFFLEEVSWIKACNYNSLDEYQMVKRIGRKHLKGEGPTRILKSSKERTIIHSVYNNYNEILKNSGLVDNEDLVELSKSKAKKEFTHIIIDDAQNLTKREIDFLYELNLNKTYSSNLYLLNKDKCENKSAWFVKGRKLDFKGLLLKNSFEKEESIAKQFKGYKLERFKYYDLKHRRDHEFTIDPSFLSEIIVSSEVGEQVFKKEELKTIPVYSDIAAGEPLYINEEQETNFYIPEYWLKGMKNCFILKVKGDSMIGANIEDGDLVVINQGHSAMNKDIVAVNIEGNATLKRLNISKTGVVLMPENEKYAPIPIKEEGASIIGVAVGIIKSKG